AGPVPRRGVRDRHRHREAARPHQGGHGAPRPLRLAPAGPLQPRPHGPDALNLACQRMVDSDSRPPNPRAEAPLAADAKAGHVELDKTTWPAIDSSCVPKLATTSS